MEESVMKTKIKVGKKRVATLVVSAAVFSSACASGLAFGKLDMPLSANLNDGLQQTSAIVITPLETTTLGSGSVILDKKAVVAKGVVGRSIPNRIRNKSIQNHVIVDRTIPNRIRE